MKNKNIIFGITGSIAAYKAASLVRLLVKEGANVKVVMTPLAKEFISPLTMATVSKNPILVDFYNPENGDWNSHVDLGLWADLMLIAPATANTLSKMATGNCDNLLIATYLSAKCPVFLAPAMDLDMFQHPATQANIQRLQSFGNHIIEPASGELASGLSGKGRMEEPENIVKALHNFFYTRNQLIGKTILLTAGPTKEAIDPVRFISNHSSGKMGYALAKELANQGANVILISGETTQKIMHPNVEVIHVISADDMYKACLNYFHRTDGAIMAAAVADYTPAQVSSTKIKKTGKDDMYIELHPTKDIAAELGKIKRDGQFLVGFALETDNEIENAKSKIQRKNLDFIVLNSLKDEGAGFQHDTNKITIIDKKNSIEKFELKTKQQTAKDIVQKLISYLSKL